MTERKPMAGHMDVNLNDVSYYTCLKCNKSFKMQAIRHKGGNTQITVTRLCEHVEIAYARIWLKEKEIDNG